MVPVLILLAAETVVTVLGSMVLSQFMAWPWAVAITVPLASVFFTIMLAPSLEDSE